MYRVELKGRDGTLYGDNVFLSFKERRTFWCKCFLKRKYHSGA